jgi:hypothetical protein
MLQAVACTRNNLLNSGGIQLKTFDVCVNNVELFVIFSVSEEVYSNTPVVKLACTFGHVEKLGMQLCEYPIEPP